MNFRRGNIGLIILPILLIVVVVIGGYLYLQKQKPVQKNVLTWEECLKVPGAVVMEMYPARCSTPDGRSAIQPLSEEEKRRLKLLPVDLSCERDSDCTLVIDQSWMDCKLQNSCEPVDYSQNKWVAVNQNWYSQSIKGCQVPAMMCDPKPVNDQFKGRCVSNICQKIPSSGSVDEATKWNEYKAVSGGFSIKYPLEWTVSEAQGQVMLSTVGQTILIKWGKTLQEPNNVSMYGKDIDSQAGIVHLAVFSSKDGVTTAWKSSSLMLKGGDYYNDPEMKYLFSANFETKNLGEISKILSTFKFL